MTSGRRTVYPMPTPPSVLQSFLWPSERHLTPKVCDHCKARLIVGDVPTADHPTVRPACLMCSRTVCELRLDGLRAPMTAAEFAAASKNQGRRIAQPSPDPEPGDCRDCGQATLSPYRQRCEPCGRIRQREVMRRNMVTYRERQRQAVRP